MRIGLFSDSHGDHAALNELLEKMGHLDAVCFMGDIAEDVVYLKMRLAQETHPPTLYAVRGNNDRGNTLPLEQRMELDGIPVYMTHGHRVAGPLGLVYQALEIGAKIALYGHTHQADYEEVMGVTLINPGSAGNFCRGGRARAMILTIQDGAWDVTPVFVDVQKNQ